MARIRLGTTVREGSRSGKVVAHRPGGMVDVRFDDVTWIERRSEKNVKRRNPSKRNRQSAPTYDPTEEQFRRVQAAIYQSQLDRGLSDAEAWRSSWPIATRQLQKHGYLIPGTQAPTRRGRKRAKEMRKMPRSKSRRQRYERGLAKHRKSRWRIVPEKHGSETWQVVQPGGKYFKGRGAKARAKAHIEDLIHNPALQGGPAALGPIGAPYTLVIFSTVLEHDLTGEVIDITGAPIVVSGGLKKRFTRLEIGPYSHAEGGLSEAKRYGKELVRSGHFEEARVFDRSGKVVWQSRSNPRDVRMLSERGASAFRQVGSLDSRARKALPKIRKMGTERGLLIKDLKQLPPSKKRKFQDLRIRYLNQIDDLDYRFKVTLRDIDLDIGESPNAVERARRALHGAYVEASNRASGQYRLNPRDIPPDYMERATGRPTSHQTRPYGLPRKRIKQIREAKDRPPPAGGGFRPTEMKPYLVESIDPSGKVRYIFVWEGKSAKIQRIVNAVNAAKGYGGRFRKLRSVSNVVWKEHPYANVDRYVLGQKKARGPYFIWDEVKKDFVGKKGGYSGPTGKRDGEKALARYQARARKEFERIAGLKITAYSTYSKKRAQLLHQKLEAENVQLSSAPDWLKRGEGQRKGRTVLGRDQFLRDEYARGSAAPVSRGSDDISRGPVDEHASVLASFKKAVAKLQ